MTVRVIRGETVRDVVVVGGGPAGITTALAFATAAPELASRIVVLEKGVYPREKYCAGALGARGDKILAELDAVPDVPSVRVDGISFRGAGGEIAAKVGAIGRVVRRIEFDHALAKIAVARGIDVRDGARVETIAVDGDDAVVESSAGTFRARTVVGADGVGSVVRKAMGLGAGSLRAQVLELDTEPVDGDPDRTMLHFDAVDMSLPGYAWDFPTVVDGRELVCRGVYTLRVPDARGGAEPDIHALLAARLARIGLDIDRYKNKRYAERGYEPTDAVADGPLMLVGEAAGIDPVTGEGIAQAIEAGALAGRFLAQSSKDETRGDWTEELASSRLARDLRIRTRFVRLFYGATRAEVERFLLDSPDALYVGCQHFAADPYDWLRLTPVLANGAARLAKVAIAELLGGR